MKTVLVSLSDDNDMLAFTIEKMVEILNGEDGRPRSRERVLTVTKLEEAALWLSQDTRKHPSK